MKVRVLTTGRADAEARRATSWWRENRQAAPYLFETELAKAIALLSEQPEVGHPFARPGFPKLRVMLLPRTRYHLYYEHHEDRGEVVIHAVWGAVRGRPPRLRRK